MSSESYSSSFVLLSFCLSVFCISVSIVDINVLCNLINIQMYAYSICCDVHIYLTFERQIYIKLAGVFVAIHF